jgi:hypothetical protein
MNASPGKGIGALLYAPISKLRRQIAYRIAALLATTFGWPFWAAEQWRGKLADELERRRP